MLARLGVRSLDPGEALLPAGGNRSVAVARSVDVSHRIEGGDAPRDIRRTDDKALGQPPVEKPENSLDTLPAFAGRTNPNGPRSLAIPPIYFRRRTRRAKNFIEIFTAETQSTQRKEFMNRNSARRLYSNVLLF
jgi:hypothetical protein